MVCIGKFVAQQGGLGTGKIVNLGNYLQRCMPRKFCGSVRWSCGSVRWSRHRKDGVPRKFCVSVRWSRHRTDGVPRKFCGKMVCLGNFVVQ